MFPSFLPSFFLVLRYSLLRTGSLLNASDVPLTPGVLFSPALDVPGAGHTIEIKATLRLDDGAAAAGRPATAGSVTGRAPSPPKPMVCQMYVTSGARSHLLLTGLAALSWNVRAHAQALGAALSCPRLDLADGVLIRRLYGGVPTFRHGKPVKRSWTHSVGVSVLAAAAGVFNSTLVTVNVSAADPTTGARCGVVSAGRPVASGNPGLNGNWTAAFMLPPADVPAGVVELDLQIFVDRSIVEVRGRRASAPPPSTAQPSLGAGVAYPPEPEPAVSGDRRRS